MMAPVLKTGRAQALVGSNPTPSAILLRANALRRIWTGAPLLCKVGCLRSFSEGGPLSLYYVYLIESSSVQAQRYVGMTTNLKQRLTEHNTGKSRHTSNSSHGGSGLTSRLPIGPKRRPSSAISNPDRATRSPISAYGKACRRRNAHHGRGWPAKFAVFD